MNVMTLNWIILPGICRPLPNNYKALLQQPEVRNMHDIIVLA